jgi:hypothetical protein
VAEIVRDIITLNSRYKESWIFCLRLLQYKEWQQVFSNAHIAFKAPFASAIALWINASSEFKTKATENQIKVSIIDCI